MIFASNLNLTTYCHELTAIARSWQNTKGLTPYLAIRRCNTRSLAGKPLAGFCATPIRRIPVLCGTVVHVLRWHTRYFIDNRRYENDGLGRIGVSGQISRVYTVCLICRTAEDSERQLYLLPVPNVYPS